jgi:exosortase/archaeosortase family protein
MQKKSFLQNFIQDIKTNKSLRYFTLRLFIFALLYAVIFNFHPQLTQYLYMYHVDNYDPYLAYLIYPMLFLFAIIRWDTIKNMPSYKNGWWDTLMFSITAIFTFLAPLRGLMLTYSFLPNEFVYNIPLTIGFIFLFYAVFNIKFVHKFGDDLFKIVYTFIIFLIARVLIGKFWIYLSFSILNVLGVVLPWFSSNVSVDSSVLNVVFNNFNVNVGAPCSGVYSLVTFFLLFGVSVILLAQKNKLDYLKTSIALLAGLALVFIFNIIRVTIIILVGGLYSQELAINLFHEYLSAIFLIAIFILYLYLVFPKIIKK